MHGPEGVRFYAKKNGGDLALADRHPRRCRVQDADHGLRLGASPAPARSRWAEISAAYLSQIETGKKPGSFDAIARLACALGISIKDLEPWRT